MKHRYTAKNLATKAGFTLTFDKAAGKRTWVLRDKQKRAKVRVLDVTSDIFALTADEFAAKFLVRPAKKKKVAA